MRCTACPEYKECSRKFDLRAKRRRCDKAKDPAPYPEGHCPYCGSSAGFFSKMTIRKFYTFQGEPDGAAEYGPETDSVFCRECFMRLGTRSQFGKEAAK